MSWIRDIVSPKTRQWEDFYRNRWQHDKIVRSTHGVNCTGSCAWMVYVKDGIVTWELQAVDYPLLDRSMPPYEPRGCQRGISASWYVYSPIRVRYPYVRGPLLDFWREARGRHSDPVEAWRSIVENPQARARYQQARGKGGFRRSNWDEVRELIASAIIYTIKKYGPDRCAGFAPIPAMSQVSWAAGGRFFQLLGGVNISFYDWYCDLPCAEPEVWGEQTDACESADWYNSKFLVNMGSCWNMTRTPCCHFAAEARHEGTKLVVLAPDFSQVSKYADWWIPLKPGTDRAFFLAATHVMLKEAWVDRQVPYFVNYVKMYSDAPFLVRLTQNKDGAYDPGRLVRAKSVAKYKDIENGDWKFLMWDEKTGDVKTPMGTVGYRWPKSDAEKGKWNLQLKDGVDGSDIEPKLSFIDDRDDVLQVRFYDFEAGIVRKRGVPVKFLETAEGRIPVTTIFDVIMAHYGVPRGLPGDYPRSFDDDNTFTPAWQEKITGIGRQTVIKFAREWTTTAELTNGKCMVIVGAAINHWYHGDMSYRSAINMLIFTGCVGRNGGGLNHYVGQEKLAAVASWGTFALAKDWVTANRFNNGPSFHYIHTDQWRYDDGWLAYDFIPEGREVTGKFAPGHTIDHNVRAVRQGWLPFFPQWNKNPLEVVREAEAAGAKNDKEIVEYVVKQLKERRMRFGVEDPDAPENWPRVWIIWRGNAIGGSMKGQEFCLKHYLGTHNNAIAEEAARGKVGEVTWREEGPRGKMDLVVDINFRMDSSALYSDIVLPTAHWYEKCDLNSTDLHSYYNVLSQAVPPSWEAMHDWDIFKSLAKKISELAQTHLPRPVKDIVMVPLEHDHADELSQPEIKDWFKGECEPIPGKTMPHFKVLERDYVNMYNKFISFGPLAREKGMGAHGASYPIADWYDEMVLEGPSVEWGGRRYYSLDDAESVANAILRLAPETNGEVAYRAYKEHEKKVGLPLADLAEGNRGVSYTYRDLQAQLRRVLTSPCWSGDTNKGRAYAPYVLNVERLIPWRTLTGRQHTYLDHEMFLAVGEEIVTWKPNPRPKDHADIRRTQKEGNSLLLNILTPHGKWHIHSTYMDNHRMLTLSRGMEPVWINDKDAEAAGIKDNDWVECYNDNGVYCARAAVSARIPRGACILYHTVERTISIPKSKVRGLRRAGGNNAITRTRLKPVLMCGGYGQFTYHANYWGPVGYNRDTYVYVKKMDGQVVM